MTIASSGRLGWEWVARCRLLGGHPTLEMFEEAVEAGDRALPLMVEVLARRSFRVGDPPDCAELPIHALRVLGALGSTAGLPALVGVLTDPVDPGLYGDEAALALARLGEPALAPLERVLTGRSRDTWIRTSAARGLMFCALRDRRLRRRVLPLFERVLLDPKERDRVFVAHLVSAACLLAAVGLLPAIGLAFQGGRVDEDVVDLESVQVDLIARHHRPDEEAKLLARRDVREDYAAWSELTEGLAAEERELLRLELERLRVEGAEPPESGAGVLGEDDSESAGDGEPGGDPGSGDDAGSGDDDWL